MKMKSKVKQNPVSKAKLNQRYENIYSRCYRKCYKKDHPAYDGVTMCDEWKDDKDSFYSWFKENYYEVGEEQMDVDKDILVKGNMVYSPDTCIIVPHSINGLIAQLAEPKLNPDTGTYGIVLSWADGMTNKRYKVDLGEFDTPEEAKQRYAECKTSLIRTKARVYKELISEKLYAALMSYTVTLDDWEKPDKVA